MLVVRGLHVSAKNNFKLCFRGRGARHPGFQPLNMLVGHKAPPHLTSNPTPCSWTAGESLGAEQLQTPNQAGVGAGIE